MSLWNCPTRIYPLGSILEVVTGTIEEIWPKGSLLFQSQIPIQCQYSKFKAVTSLNDIFILALSIQVTGSTSVAVSTVPFEAFFF